MEKFSLICLKVPYVHCEQGAQSTSRNPEHFRCFETVKRLLRDQRNQPHLMDADGEPIKLFIQPGETVVLLMYAI
jgi:hypothetical protein